MKIKIRKRIKSKIKSKITGVPHEKWTGG